MSASRFYVANLDLSNILQPYTSGATTVTRFYSNNVDIGTIYQAYGSGTKANATNLFVGTNDLNNLFQKYATYVTSGLINYYNFQTSYSGSGTSVTNLVTSSADMTLKNSPTYNSTTKTMLFSNSSASAIKCMQSNSTLSNFQTVSIWYKQLAQTSSYFYLFDGRATAGTTTAYILNPAGGGVGSFWSTMYIDGGASLAQPITDHWSSAEFTNGTWHNMTFTSPSALSQAGFVTIAGNRAIVECANIEIAAVMVYNRAITQTENAQNYTYMKSVFSSLGFP